MESGYTPATGKFADMPCLYNHFLPHRVKFVGSQVRSGVLYAWLVEHCRGDWSFDQPRAPTGHYNNFSFTEADDALLFKLTWNNVGEIDA
jgi:hypothetical protein